VTASILSARSGRGRSARVRAWAQLLVISAASVALWGGCKSVALPKVRLPSLASSPAYAPANHVNAGAIPAHVRRVAVLPLHTDTWRPSEVVRLDEALRGELARVERFELVLLSRDDLRSRFDRDTYASATALPGDFLSRLRADFGVDAVLLLDLSHYAPYQPVAIGLRAKLVTADEGLALWSFDSVFDSSRTDVATAARKFSSERNRPAPAAEDNTGVLQSPSRFAKYVGHAAFETLPPRRTE
jgi:hypothetical protein